MPKTAVVILNYNGVGFLKQFLPGVIALSPDADVIVADNGSTDGSLDYLRRAHPELRLIVFDQNYGFTGGYNRAIDQIDHEYTVLLNSDIEVTPHWITPIVEFLDEHPEVAACQPKIKAYYEKDKFEYAGAAGGFIDALAYPYCRGRIFDTLESDTGQYDTIQPIFWATGACLFIRTADYQAVGGLDEDFFAHMEEIDLCWRLQLQDKLVYCLPESTVYHVGGGTLSKINPQKTYLNFRNNLSMIFKNESRINLIWKLPLRMSLDWISALKFWKDESFAHCLAILRAHKDFVLLLPQNTKKRRKPTHRANPKMTQNTVKSILFHYFIKKQKHFSDLP
ncbi:glycosyl transferase family 2 [Reichenbachiella sp. 5M10]|uniref:glycosyltransferase family 2 protein n=1 Tax=Reichenbachiella sp. 5M10 TaxID=1889772 RepID=UPI000C14535D|nr:glycosyltransferase family 2 protein [Reichenbachiella sp. 5M10]PIB35177.1 glycosyl transferase family 2 [Reichenbachiella sp. 5M10]